MELVHVRELKENITIKVKWLKVPSQKMKKMMKMLPKERIIALKTGQCLLIKDELKLCKQSQV